MWCPAMAALMTCKLTGREIGTLGWQWGDSRYQWFSYFIPLGYAALAYMVVWLTGFGRFYDPRFVAQITKSFGLGSLPAGVSIGLYMMLAGTAGMVGSCSTALGEEIGWRGFLVPELASRVSYTKTALLSGCIWSVWHYPILIFADYNAGTPTWYALTCFTVMVVAISVVFTWMRLKSGSLWTGMLLHASHNLFIQEFFDPITRDTGHTKYVIGEFGAALPLAAIVVAFYFWTRRAEIEPIKIAAVA
jgi:membrane protease YdiL (CAAX protease family)